MRPNHVEMTAGEFGPGRPEEHEGVAGGAKSRGDGSRDVGEVRDGRDHEGGGYGVATAVARRVLVVERILPRDERRGERSRGGDAPVDGCDEVTHRRSSPRITEREIVEK